MRNPEFTPKFTTDPRSTVISKYANPLDLPQKSTIRALFNAKSVDPKTYSPSSVRNAIILQHLFIQLPRYYLSSGRLREVKNKRNFEFFSPKIGRGPSREVAA